MEVRELTQEVWFQGPTATAPPRGKETPASSHKALSAEPTHQEQESQPLLPSRVQSTHKCMSEADINSHLDSQSLEVGKVVFNLSTPLVYEEI